MATSVIVIVQNYSSYLIITLYKFSYLVLVYLSHILRILPAYSAYKTSPWKQVPSFQNYCNTVGWAFTKTVMMIQTRCVHETPWAGPLVWILWGHRVKVTWLVVLMPPNSACPEEHLCQRRKWYLAILKMFGKF